MFHYAAIFRHIPLFVCGGVFAFSILILAIGPLDWHISDPLALYSFLIACLFALVGGYVLCVVRSPISHIRSRLPIDINHLMLVCCVVTLLMYLPTVYARTGKWYPDIYTGLTNAGQAYRAVQEYAVYGNQTFEYLRILVSPFIAMTMPLTFFYFAKLNRVNRILGIVIIILNVFLALCQGTNKLLADITAQLVLCFSLLFFANTKKTRREKVMHRLKYGAGILLTVLVFFACYTVIMRGRIGTDVAAGEDPASANVSSDEIDAAMAANSQFGFATEADRFSTKLINVLPSRVRSAALFLSSYLSHGYKGLSLAMESDFTSSYGLGFSEFFRRNFLRVIGQQHLEESIELRTYEQKTIEKGWPTGAVWSSFFIFPASDISFPGTVILVFLIGYLFSLSWRDAVVSHNPFALVVFLNFCIMVVYFSANNQVFQSGEGFVGITGNILLWLLTRHRIAKKSAGRIPA